MSGPRVDQVLIGTENVTTSRQEESISLSWDGVMSDRHYGRTKSAGVREKYTDKGNEILNLRQVSLVSVEELEEIAEKMDVPLVTGSDLGANIVVIGIDNFSDIEPGTILKFSSGALLFVTSENLPCRHPGENIQERYPDREGLASQFPKAAMGRRGLVAMVLRPGTVGQSDNIEVID